MYTDAIRDTGFCINIFQTNTRTMKIWNKKFTTSRRSIIMKKSEFTTYFTLEFKMKLKYFHGQMSQKFKQTMDRLVTVQCLKTIIIDKNIFKFHYFIKHSNPAMKNNQKQIIAKLSPSPNPTQLGAELVIFPYNPATHPPDIPEKQFQR